ncbi:MAG: hypothetical protein L0Y71_24250 [Gemmataceae bacterium]|nr:hypothetical protein [Gemmataceae bacterium]
MASSSNLRGWKWTAFLLGTLWVSIGCNPGSLSMLLVPFSDDRIPPKCPLATKKEVTVCVVPNFATLETRPEVIPAEAELAELFAQQLRKRAEVNRERIRVVPPAKVRSYQNRADFASRSLYDVGKHFEADYVISLEITNLALYEKASHNTLYRGNTEIAVNVVDMKQPAGEGTIFTEHYRREYPSSGPRDASDGSVARFRAIFLNTVATDLARLFTAYPSDERRAMD